MKHLQTEKAEVNFYQPPKQRIGESKSNEKSDFASVNSHIKPAQTLLLRLGQSCLQLTHPSVDIVLGGFILLLHALLQEIDAQLEAEVLLLQVIEVLGQSTVSIRHGWGSMGWGLAAHPFHSSNMVKTEKGRRAPTKTVKAAWLGGPTETWGQASELWVSAAALWLCLRCTDSGAEYGSLSFFTSKKYLWNPWQRFLLREPRHKWRNLSWATVVPLSPHSCPLTNCRRLTTPCVREKQGEFGSQAQRRGVETACDRVGCGGSNMIKVGPDGERREAPQSH